MSIASQFPLLEDRRLVALINEAGGAQGLYATQGANAFCPITALTSAKIEWEMRFAMTGLLNAQHRDAHIPLNRVPGIASFEFDAPVWRTKWVLRESDLTEIRTPGQREGRYGDRLITDLMNDGAMLTDRSIEFAAWQALAGTLTVKYEDATSDTIDYRLPAFLNPTASPLWSDVANADPYTDIVNWLQLLEDIGVMPGRFVVSRSVYNHLLQNSKIRTLVQSQMGREVLMNKQALEMLLGYPLDVYNGTYMMREFVGATYTTGTSLTLGDGGQLADLGASDELILGPSTHSANPRAIEKVGVTSVSGVTVTLDGAMTNDFAVGDPVTWHRKYLADDKFVILPMSDGQRWLEYGVAPSRHVNYEARKYAKSTEIPQSEIKVEVMAGVDGAPIMYRQGRHVYADVA